MSGAYIRKLSIPTHLIVAAIDKGAKRYGIGNGLYVSLAGARIRTFAKGCDCVHCGKKGHFFAAERHRKSDPNKLHLNLYHVQKGGAELMMTSDHIIAKANGGGNSVENRQPMCQQCNSLKADFDTMEEAVAAKGVRVERDSSPIAFAQKIAGSYRTIQYAKQRLGEDKKWSHILSKSKLNIVNLKRHLQSQFDVCDYRELLA